MSNATLYRVELLSTDNPAALISCAFSLSHPHSSTVVLLSLCHFTSPHTSVPFFIVLRVFCCCYTVLFSHLSLFIKSVLTRELASCSGVWLITICVHMCVALLGAVNGMAVSLVVPVKEIMS